MWSTNLRRTEIIVPCFADPHMGRRACFPPQGRAPSPRQTNLAKLRHAYQIVLEAPVAHDDIDIVSLQA
jgi:hypothetical protein